MSAYVIPLGTASAIPTRQRHLSAMALVRDGRILLFDCGEGTQIRMIHAGVKHMRIEAIFITHFHGDHFFGLFGLLSTLALLKRSHPLTVVGPLGIADLVRRLPGLSEAWLPFAVEYVELSDTLVHEVVYDTTEFTVTARPVEHRTFTAGFRYEEKPRPGTLNVELARALGVTDPLQYRHLKQGRTVRAGGREVRAEDVMGPARRGCTFSYVTDTRPCEGGVMLARDADLLYHEATFGENLAQRAIDTGHTTAAEAARVARDAGATRLLIGHFSARYKDVSSLLGEARAVFPATEAAEELRQYAIG